MAPEENASAAGQEPQENEGRTAPEQQHETEAPETDWKALARKWEREAKKNQTTAAKAMEEAERIREANSTEAEKALAAARREGQQAAEKEWKTKWQTERLHGEALRLMNGKVSDPRLAFPHLDLDGVMDDNGKVNSKALEKAVDDLLAEFPALSAATAGHHMDLGPKQNNTRPTKDMNDLLRRAAGRT
jgi:hypothetical protein